MSAPLWRSVTAARADQASRWGKSRLSHVEGVLLTTVRESGPPKARGPRPGACQWYLVRRRVDVKELGRTRPWLWTHGLQNCTPESGGRAACPAKDAAHFPCRGAGHLSSGWGGPRGARPATGRWLAGGQTQVGDMSWRLQGLLGALLNASPLLGRARCRGKLGLQGGSHTVPDATLAL